VKWFRRGLVFKAHRLVYHSTLGRRVIKKKKKTHHEVQRAEENRALRLPLLLTRSLGVPELHPLGFRVQGSGFRVQGLGFRV